VVLFTGFRAASLEDSITSAGGSIAKSFTKAVTLVVAKDASIGTGKVAQAVAKGIPIADATSLARALGTSGALKTDAGPGVPVKSGAGAAPLKTQVKSSTGKGKLVCTKQHTNLQALP
jgi:hypothetical protein